MSRSAEATTPPVNGPVNGPVEEPVDGPVEEPNGRVAAPRRRRRPGSSGRSRPQVLPESRASDHATDESAHARLVALARRRGELRADLIGTAAEFVRGPHGARLGYARLGDYAQERLGVSGRELTEWAYLGRWARAYPALDAALRDGTLGWSKVRLLPRVMHAETAESWLSLAKRFTCEELARAAKQVGTRRMESHADRARRWHGRTELACSPTAYAKWRLVQQWACKVHGSLRVSALEAMTAETVSWLGLDVELAEPGPPLDARAGLPVRPEPQGDPPEDGSSGGCPLPRDAHGLDARMRALVRAEQRLLARLGPLLELVVRRRVYRKLGYSSLNAYAREQLGMSGRKAQMLVRIERACAGSPELGRAYREGDLSWAQAQLLVPLVGQHGRRCWHVAWVARAQQVSVRRLREDVAGARLLLEMFPGEYWETGGLPGPDELGVISRLVAKTCARAERRRKQWGESVSELEVRRVALFGPRDQQALFHAALQTVRLRLERATGRIATAGEAFEVMLDHALESWQAPPRPWVSRLGRILERDGWCCRVPGCTSQRNLQVHHVVFRSQGGGEEDSNKITLCAWHHLRGVHSGVVRIVGKAPRGLRFVLGVRPDGPPLVSYASGDRLLA